MPTEAYSRGGSLSDIDGGGGDGTAPTTPRERWRTLTAISGAGVVVLTCLGAWLWPGWLPDAAEETQLVEPSLASWWFHPVEELPAFKTMKTSPDLNAIAFTGEHGWIVGEKGTILTTDDGGDSWRAEPSGLTTALRDVEISVPTLGPGLVAPRENITIVALAEDGTLLRHEDDDTWEKWSNPGTPTTTTSDFSRLVLADYDSVLAGGAEGVWSGSTRQTTNGQIEVMWAPVGGDRAGSSDVTYLDRRFAITREGRWLDLKYGLDLKFGLSQDAKTNTQKTSRVPAHVSKGWSATARDPSPLPVPKSEVGWLDYADFDSELAWVVGGDGAVAKTVDGGKTWSMLEIGANETLACIAFRFSERGEATGEGWILGFGDTIYRTIDSGAKWTPLPSTGIETGLHQLCLDDRGKLWVIGAWGVLMSSADGGETWHRHALYRLWPARIYWLLGGAGMFAILTALAWPMRELEIVRSIEHVLVADKPLDNPARSPTWMRKLVAGLANFMSNPQTAAPVTISITGPWGRGKSSVMSLLKKELERREHRPVWFNAWHNQDSENVLASLLETVREQAIPPLIAFPAEPPFVSFPGLWFYLRLTVQRARRRWAYVAGLSVVLLTALSWLVLHWNKLKQIQWGTLIHSVATDGLPGLLGALVVGSYPLVKLLGMLKTFGIDPATLLASGAGKVKDLAAANVFRARFGVEFAEVTAALGRRHRMVIFIDDLDRCAPGHLLKVLEATNTLNSSGQCFIVLGMQRETVLAALQSSLDPALLGGTATPEKWLEKLVQIEVPVPRDDQALAGIAGETAKPDPGEAAQAKRRARQRLAVLVPCGLTVATLVVMGCLQLAASLTIATPKPENVTKPQTAADALASTEAATEQPAGAARPPRKRDEPDGVLLTTDEPNLGTANAFSRNAVILGSAVLGALLLQGALRRRFAFKVEDSQAFLRAITLWAPVVQTRCETPREIKVLINRMRLDAMLVREFTPPPSTAQTAEQETGSSYEADVVGLAVLERFAPQGLSDGAWLDVVRGAQEQEALLQAGSQAIATYQSEPFRLFRLFKDRIRS